jgi:hypothetical protein
MQLLYVCLPKKKKKKRMKKKKNKMRTAEFRFEQPSFGKCGVMEPFAECGTASQWGPDSVNLNSINKEFVIAHPN